MAYPETHRMTQPTADSAGKCVASEKYAQVVSVPLALALPIVMACLETRRMTQPTAVNVQTLVPLIKRAKMGHV